MRPAASRFAPAIRSMEEEAKTLTAAPATGPSGRVGIEDAQLKRKAMYWLFWLFLVGSLLLSVTHTVLS